MARKDFKLVSLDFEVLAKLKKRAPDLSPNNILRKFFRLPLHLPRGRHKPKTPQLDSQNNLDKENTQAQNPS